MTGSPDDADLGLGSYTIPPAGRLVVEDLLIRINEVSVDLVSN